ncbi:MAG: hypothetical protein EXR45_01390 [Chloroflexi bacterium]|nr:hypothetical protein [Chloroflexota bacterium]
MANTNVRADVISANEFPSYSAQFAVQAVPKTVVNKGGEILGARPEGRFVSEVLLSLGIEPNTPPMEPQ